MYPTAQFSDSQVNARSYELGR